MTHRQQDRRLRSELREALQHIYGRNLSQLILYGSRARGDHDEDSDFDVLVVFCRLSSASAERARLESMVSALSLHYEKVITCHFVGEREYLTRRSPLLLNVRREGVEL